MTAHEVVRLGWVLPFVMILASCGETAPAEDALSGRSFLLDSAEGFEPVANTTVQLAFREGEMSFQAGCNHHGGPYELKDGRLNVRSLGSTEMGCDPERHAQDTWLAQFFTSSPELTLEGDHLTLIGTAATLFFLDREVADPDRPLVGPTWSIDTFIEGDAASNYPLAVTPTVRFKEDGSIEVFSGCNSSGGSYVVSGSELTLGGMAYTEAGCDVNTKAAEAHVQSVLTDGTLNFEIEAARLTVLRGDIGLGATTD